MFVVVQTCILQGSNHVTRMGIRSRKTYNGQRDTIASKWQCPGAVLAAVNMVRVGAGQASAGNIMFQRELDVLCGMQVIFLSL